MRFSSGFSFFVFLEWVLLVSQFPVFDSNHEECKHVCSWVCICVKCLSVVTILIEDIDSMRSVLHLPFPFLCLHLNDFLNKYYLCDDP